MAHIHNASCACTCIANKLTAKVGYQAMVGFDWLSLLMVILQSITDACGQNNDAEQLKSKAAGALAPNSLADRVHRMSVTRHAKKELNKEQRKDEKLVKALVDSILEATVESSASEVEQVLFDCCH